MRTGTTLLILVCFAGLPVPLSAQKTDSARQSYLAELKMTGRKFSGPFYANYDRYYALPEKIFIEQMDSVRQELQAVLDKYKQQLDPVFAAGQEAEIKYYFDKLLIEYPMTHELYAEKKETITSRIPDRLKSNLPDFNQPSLLSNEDFTNYVRAYFAYQARSETKKQAYNRSDNKQLDAVWQLIPRYISNQQCRDFWRFDYLRNHIENDGIKNIASIYTDFKTTCRDTGYLNKLQALYAEDSLGRQGHTIRTYKSVGPFKLDMHLFLPEAVNRNTKKTAIVFFHGGSWSEGKPDWFFSSCENYARKGWVAMAVEYRTYGRHGTLPFDAVMDARSAIRWVREHAAEYNIDTTKIIASGNSAGGHMVLCTALADKWNERTDNLQFSPVPNALMVNSAVYDLTDRVTAWIRKDLADKNTVKEISPIHLARKQFPPALLIHATADRNVPYSSAKIFTEEMLTAGNRNIEFQTLTNAGHFIWYDPKYAGEVSKLRSDFLMRLQY